MVREADVIEVMEDGDSVDEVQSSSPCLVPDTEILSGIQKLNGRENYSVWKFQIKNLLNYEELWYPVVGYPDDDDTDEATKARKDAKALARINLMIGVNCISHTMRARTAAEAWQTLERVFEEKGRVHLFQKLFSVKAQNYPTVQDYINDVTWISEVIAETGNPVDPEILGAILLQGLPDYDTYKPLILQTESSGSTVTSDMVITWLMMNYDESEDTEFNEIVEEKRSFGKWIQETTTEIGERVVKTITMTFRARAVRNSAMSKSNAKIVCWNCHQAGHVRAQCPNASGRLEEESMGKKIGKQISTIVVESALVRAVSFAGTAVGGAVGGAVGTAVGTAGVLLRKVFRVKRQL